LQLDWAYQGRRPELTQPIIEMRLNGRYSRPGS
jgi:hypothetical protein